MSKWQWKCEAWHVPKTASNLLSAHYYGEILKNIITTSIILNETGLMLFFLSPICLLICPWPISKQNSKPYQLSIISLQFVTLFQGAQIFINNFVDILNKLKNFWKHFAQHLSINCQERNCMPVRRAKKYAKVTSRTLCCTTLCDSCPRQKQAGAVASGLSLMLQLN